MQHIIFLITNDNGLCPRAIAVRCYIIRNYDRSDSRPEIVVALTYLYILYTFFSVRHANRLFLSFSHVSKYSYKYWAVSLFPSSPLNDDMYKKNAR